MLGHNEICFTCPRGFPLICILAVQQDNDIRVLLYAIVESDSICYKVMATWHGRIINILRADAFDRLYLIPAHVVRREHLEFGVCQDFGYPPHTLA